MANQSIYKAFKKNYECTKEYIDSELEKIQINSGGGGNAENSESAEKDSEGNVITETYETKTDASDKLTEAKGYTDSKIENLMNNSSEAIDSIFELRDAMSDNKDAITALQEIAGSKANASDLTSHIENKNNPHEVTLSQLGINVTADELNNLDGVISNIEEQIEDVKNYTDTEIEKVVTGAVDKAGKDSEGNVITETYETKTDASTKIEAVKSYTDEQINTHTHSQLYDKDTAMVGVTVEEDVYYFRKMDGQSIQLGNATNPWDGITATTGTFNTITIENEELETAYAALQAL